MTRKLKIFNDPVYGFISVNDPLIQELLDHPYFQRLGRISQLGLSYLVYPGAHHTRFHHALGAMHLMGEALEVLQQKGIEISEEECQAAKIAIMLHDIGHGPFSHTLEHSIMKGISHEEISLRLMNELNELHGGKLTTAIDIFRGRYPRRFFHQLVSGQLDTDRLDYLMRDSFYTGVAEGIIGSERLIKMMNVTDEELVVEEKGIYSIEKFLIARRLMYWQVYLHKTVLGAEALLTSILKRARELAQQGKELFCTSSLRPFLYDDKILDDPQKSLLTFVRLDDMDIMASIKEWAQHPDFILKDLCDRLINRKLFRVKLRTEPFEAPEIEEIKEKVKKKLGLENNKEIDYYVTNSFVSTLAYDASKDEIRILKKDGVVARLFDVSDHLTPEDMNKKITKHFVCFPKDIE